MIPKPTAKAMAWIRLSEKPAAASTGSSSDAIAGSPRAPSPREDRDAELAHGEVGVELVGGLLEEPDERRPSRTSPSTCVERIFTSPNSAATNRPFRATRKQRQDDQQAIED
jgi:hypothetical protein